MIAAFGHPGEQEYRFDGERAIYLRFFPKYDDGQPRLGRTATKTLAHERRLVKAMSPTIGGLSSANDYGWIAIDPSDTDRPPAGILSVLFRALLCFQDIVQARPPGPRP